jgi:SAM-dependent methyltransferase
VGIDLGRSQGLTAAVPQRSTPHFYERLAEIVGPGYLRYSFTRSTESEVAFVADALGLASGERVLDVGCGPGRHSHALARRGLRVVGVDVAEPFVDLARQHAPDGATFVRGDARRLPVRPASMDAVVCLCQGGFGLLGGGEDEGAALGAMAAALRVGGRLALSAVSAYFVLRFLEKGDTFDADLGVNHEVAQVRDHRGGEAELDLWTTCFTPRELRLLCSRAGLEVRHIWSVGPGQYARRAPDLDHPESLVVAERRAGSLPTGSLAPGP